MRLFSVYKKLLVAKSDRVQSWEHTLCKEEANNPKLFLTSTA